jgi:hypothetical protein
MKKLLLAFALILIVSKAFCQNTEYQTIFGNNPVSASGFGGFDMLFSSIGGNYAVGAGGSCGVLIGNQVFFGGFGMGSMLDKTFEIDNTLFSNTSMGCGGLMFGYIFNSRAAIHPAVFIQTGWGGITMHDEMKSITDNIFVLNPSLELELNFSRFFRIAIGAHYQYTMGVNKYSELGDDDFSGPGGKLSLRFGWF